MYVTLLLGQWLSFFVFFLLESGCVANGIDYLCYILFVQQLQPVLILQYRTE